MKKNTMMRIASILLIAVLVSTSAISGTYAKYVTSGTGTDTARVAKWGVTVTADSFTDYFTNEYGTDSAWEDDDGVSVKADVDVVAPGTWNFLANFDVSGTPEVDVEVTYDAELTLENWEIASGEYCPIEIFVGDNVYEIDDDGYITSVEELEKRVEEVIEASAKKYNAGTNLEDVSDDLVVGWRWEFEGLGPSDYQTDAKDTELGNRFAKGEAMATIKLEVTCTVTQID